MENNKKVCQLVDYYEKFMLAQLDIRVDIYPIFEPMQEVEEVQSSTETNDGEDEIGVTASELYMMRLSQDGDMSTNIAEEKLEDNTKDEAKDGKQDEPIPEEVMEDVPYKESSDAEIETKNSDETMNSDLVMEELRKLIENSSKCESELFLLGLSQDGDMSTDVAEENLKDDANDEPKDDEQEDPKRESPIEVMEEFETTNPDDSVMVKVKGLIENFLGLSQDRDMSSDVEENLEDDANYEYEIDAMRPDGPPESVMVKMKELLENSLGLSQDGDMSSDVAEEELNDDTPDEPMDDEQEDPSPKEVMEDVPYKESSDAEDEIESKNSHETGSAVENVQLIENSSKCEIEKPTEPRCMLIEGKRAKLQISKDLHRTLEETL